MISKREKLSENFEMVPFETVLQLFVPHNLQLGKLNLLIRRSRSTIEWILKKILK